VCECVSVFMMLLSSTSNVEILCVCVRERDEVCVHVRVSVCVGECVRV